MGHGSLERLAEALEKWVQVLGTGGVLDDARSAAAADAMLEVLSEGALFILHLSQRSCLLGLLS